jgi:hypothetical protein
MKRKNSSAAKRERRESRNSSFGAPCKLCGEICADPLSMLLHLAGSHPLELLQNPAAQKVLSKAQQASYDFGVTLADLLKGKS